MCPHLVDGERRTGPQHQKGLDRLATVGVRDADHGDLGNLGDRRQNLLDLGRVDVESTRDNDFLLPVDDLEPALGIHPRDVAGEDPAILGQRPLGGLRVLPVAGEHLRAPHQQLTGFAHRHFPGVVVPVDDFRFGGRDGQPDPSRAGHTSQRTGVGQR